MIEQSLVYIRTANPPRRFVGCGALVEGGYIATCRHVWRMAIENVAKGQPAAAPVVEIEYPYSWENSARVTTLGRMADICDGASGPTPDLVLLTPDFTPHGLIPLPLAPCERFEVGEGYAFVGLRGLDKGNPNAVKEAS